MLGQRLAEYYKKIDDIELMCASVEESSFIEGVSYSQVDITLKDDVKKLIFDFYPDFIINSAGFTNVDACETERDLAWKINVKGVEHLAQYSRNVDSTLIHMSTDYVFDGKKGPYSEKDKTNPISYYGRTKLASENALRISGSKYVIFRTNVLYGPVKYGKQDFVRWIVNSLREGKQIKIVTDQINNPAYVDDLVQAVAKVIEFRKEGIYNIAGAEFLSRFKFTEMIADFFKLDKQLITPILTEELNQPAHRPLKSGLITIKAQAELGFKPHSIRETLELMKREIFR
ncbi:MAG: dTDP-4-dehydrorhamnose reductase [Ignavibacteria bacterium RBG_13_36_8]|nr:MAG: dTDP-4-dehydrorhamnose reductase [Ignavibacteria bacterium RBG_13_36_8]